MLKFDNIGDQNRKCSKCKMIYEVNDGDIIYNEKKQKYSFICKYCKRDESNTSDIINND